ncbi:MAG: putative DNA-binding domain-containing protein [Myxococcota bacterium]
MASLSDLQHTIHGALRGERPLDEVARSLDVPAARLGLYRQFVAHHVRSVLDKNYPALRELLPEGTWDRLCDAFFRERPPATWELNAAVQPFPEWLAQREEAGLDGLAPFHVALASFEWEEFATYVHPARIPDPETLDEAILNPTLNAFESPCPVIGFMVRRVRGESVAGAPLPTPEDGPEIVLMFRHPVSRRVAWYRGVDDLLFALKVAHDRRDPARAARSVGLPVDAALAAWQRAVEIGLVVAPGDLTRGRTASPEARAPTPRSVLGDRGSTSPPDEEKSP